MQVIIVGCVMMKDVDCCTVMSSWVVEEGSVVYMYVQC